MCVSHNFLFSLFKFSPHNKPKNSHKSLVFCDWKNARVLQRESITWNNSALKRLIIVFFVYKYTQRERNRERKKNEELEHNEILRGNEIHHLRAIFIYTIVHFLNIRLSLRFEQSFIFFYIDDALSFVVDFAIESDHEWKGRYINAQSIARTNDSTFIIFMIFGVYIRT